MGPVKWIPPHERIAQALETKMKPCPECDGFGEHTWDVDYVDRGGLGGMSPVQRTAKCERCNGEGKIEDDRGVCERLIEAAWNMPESDGDHARIWWLANNAQGTDMTDDDRLEVLAEIEALTKDIGSRYWLRALAASPVAPREPEK